MFRCRTPSCDDCVLLQLIVHVTSNRYRKIQHSTAFVEQSTVHRPVTSEHLSDQHIEHSDKPRLIYDPHIIISNLIFSQRSDALVMTQVIETKEITKQLIRVECPSYNLKKKKKRLFFLKWCAKNTYVLPLFRTALHITFLILFLHLQEDESTQEYKEIFYLYSTIVTITTHGVSKNTCLKHMFFLFRWSYPNLKRNWSS